jgi:hypothetical protein
MVPGKRFPSKNYNSASPFNLHVDILFSCQVLAIVEISPKKYPPNSVYFRLDQDTSAIVPIYLQEGNMSKYMPTKIRGHTPHI